MSTETPTRSEGIEEIQTAIDRILAGKRDPVAQRQALDRMNRMREEMRQRTGTIEVAVELVRESRNP